jgi:hypothetical protein
MSQPSGPAERPARLPDYGLTVHQTEDEHGHALFVVSDASGICETAAAVTALSPMARITWASQQGMTSEQIAAAGLADGLMYRGIALPGDTPPE